VDKSHTFTPARPPSPTGHARPWPAAHHSSPRASRADAREPARSHHGNGKRSRSLGKACRDDHPVRGPGVSPAQTQGLLVRGRITGDAISSPARGRTERQREIAVAPMYPPPSAATAPLISCHPGSPQPGRRASESPGLAHTCRIRARLPVHATPIKRDQVSAKAHTPISLCQHTPKNHQSAAGGAKAPAKAGKHSGHKRSPTASALHP